jgi:hypothetical protein
MATGWPCHSARPAASGGCGGERWPGQVASLVCQGLQAAASAAASNTAHTPSPARAAARSSRRMRACACGLRRKAACSTRGKRRSSA